MKNRTNSFSRYIGHFVLFFSFVFMGCAHHSPGQALGRITQSDYSLALTKHIVCDSQFVTVMTESALGNGEITILWQNRINLTTIHRIIESTDSSVFESDHRNSSISDGYQLSILMARDGNTFRTHIANVYLEPIDSIVTAVNALVPNKWHIAYPKAKLLELSQ